MRAIVIGTAHPHSRLYQQTLAQIDGLTFIYIVDDGGNIATEFSDIPVLDATEALEHSASLLLEGSPFDLAFLFLPNDEVAPVARDLIKAGKHIFCDKPVTRTTDELATLCALASNQRTLLSAGYTWRIHPVTNEIKNMIDAGYIGTLQHIEARMMTTTIETRGASHVIFNKEKSGGGITHWLGTHHIDLLRYLTSDEVVAVSAMTNTVTSEAVDVEDVTSATLRLSHGCLVGLQQGYLLPTPTNDPFHSSQNDMFLCIRGSHGWIKWDMSTPGFDMYSVDKRFADAPTQHIRCDTTSRKGYGGEVGFEMIQRTLDAIKNDSDPPASGQDALETLRVVEAIYESAHTGRIALIEHSPEC